MASEAREKDEEQSESGFKPQGGLVHETREFFKAIAWAFAIAVVLRSFVVEAYKIPSGSMLPTLEIGDHIFVNKFLYGFMIPGTTIKFFQWRRPRQGEVIVFKYPDDTSKDYIKRVIGVPGDVIDVKNDELYVNGKRQPAVYQREMPVVDQGCVPGPARLYTERLDTGVTHLVIRIPGRDGFSDGPFVVPPGRLFVMDDNRDNSSDSAHAHYTVPFENVKGHAMFIWLSWDSCGSWWPFHKIRWNRFGEPVP